MYFSQCMGTVYTQHHKESGELWLIDSGLQLQITTYLHWLDDGSPPCLRTCVTSEWLVGLGFMGCLPHIYSVHERFTLKFCRITYIKHHNLTLWCNNPYRAKAYQPAPASGSYMSWISRYVRARAALRAKSSLCRAAVGDIKDVYQLLFQWGTG